MLVDTFIRRRHYEPSDGPSFQALEQERARREEERRDRHLARKAEDERQQKEKEKRRLAEAEERRRNEEARKERRFREERRERNDESLDYDKLDFEGEEGEDDENALRLRALETQARNLIPNYGSPPKPRSVHFFRASVKCNIW